MVDVVRNDRATGGELGPDEFDIALLAERHEPHLRGDDALPGVVHLGHRAAGLGATRNRFASLPLLRRRTSADGRTTIVGDAVAAGVIRLSVEAVLDPRKTQSRQPLLRNAARSDGAVDIDWIVGTAVRVLEFDAGDGNADAVFLVINPCRRMRRILLEGELVVRRCGRRNRVRRSCGWGRCFRGECSHLQSSLPTPVSTGSGSTVSDDAVRSQPLQRAPVGSCNSYHD